MNRSRLVLGPTFVAIGVLALTGQAGWVDAWGLVTDWWPMLVLWFGLAQLVGRPRNPVGGAISILVGAGLLAFTLGAVDSLTLLWPLLLVGLGLWLLLARPTVTTTHLSSLDDLVAVFDDRDLRVPPGPFRGGTATTVFGDLDLDLSAATLPDGEATLQVTTVFGDVDVTVPPEWEIRVNGPEIFGSVRVPSPPPVRDDADGPAPVLHLRAATVFGDLTVRAAARPGAGSVTGAASDRA
jgi:hypothetical protein